MSSTEDAPVAAASAATTQTRAEVTDVPATAVAGAGTGAGAGAGAGTGAGAAGAGAAGTSQTKPVFANKKGSQEGRMAFTYNDRTVYEWEQNLEEVHVYISPPPGVKAKMLDIKITSTHVKIGIKGNPPFISESLQNTVVAAESYWMMEDGELHLNLQKTKKADTWPCVFKGHAALDPYTTTQVQKKMMLERFQEENPGFDFSQADFNGNIPDPRTFMGGVKYQ